MLTFGLAANAQVAFSEDFEGTAQGQVPTGWTTIADNLTNYSSYANFGQSWIVAEVEEGNNAAVSISYTTPEGNDCDRWLISPSINVPASGYTLTAALWGRSASYPEKVSVKISTTGTDKTDFTQVLDVVMNGNTYNVGWNNIMVNLDEYAGQDIYIAFVNHGDGYYTFVDNVKVWVMPENGVAYHSAEAQAYTPAGGNCPVWLTVQNTGSATLTSFDYVVTLNGAVYGDTVHVTGLNLHTFGVTVQPFNVTVGGVGQYTIGMTVMNPNGAADADESDNSGSVSTSCFDASGFAHNVLIENFTTGQCQYCPAGHERLEEAVAPVIDNVVWVAHHTGYGSDPMTLPQSEEIAGLYGTNQTWAPAMAIDRNGQYASGAENGGVVGSVGASGEITSMIMQDLNTPAKVTLEWDGLSYNADTREVTVTVKGMLLESFSDELHMNLWVVEDGIAGTQVDASAGGTVNYTHNHVLRTLVTPTWGENIFDNTNAYANFSKSYTFTLANNINADNAHLVAFIGKAGASATVFTDRHVFHAIQSNKLTADNLGVETQEMNAAISVYPNPTTEMAYINANSPIRSMVLTDVNGRRVREVNNMNANVVELNVSGIAAGVYFVTIVTDNGICSERLNVVK